MRDTLVPTCHVTKKLQRLDHEDFPEVKDLQSVTNLRKVYGALQNFAILRIIQYIFLFF